MRGIHQAPSATSAAGTRSIDAVTSAQHSAATTSVECSDDIIARRCVARLGFPFACDDIVCLPQVSEQAGPRYLRGSDSRQDLNGQQARLEHEFFYHHAPGLNLKIAGSCAQFPVPPCDCAGTKRASEQGARFVAHSACNSAYLQASALHTSVASATASPFGSVWGSWCGGEEGNYACLIEALPCRSLVVRYGAAACARYCGCGLLARSTYSIPVKGDPGRRLIHCHYVTLARWLAGCHPRDGSPRRRWPLGRPGPSS
eukprot:COSAG05_NODE_397_length_10301_cov_65.155852_1_plen_258_part_00